MNIVIVNRQRKKKINSRFLKQMAAALFMELEITEAEFGINLVGAGEMALVNETFLHHEGPTDVITFDHTEKPKAKSQKQKTLNGELFVCVDVAMAQAKQFKTSWQSEVVRYIVHGVLHLLGYDDLKPAWRGEMKRAENRLVRGLETRFSLAQLSRPVKISG